MRQRLIPGPFSAGRLLMSANDRAVDHQISVVAIGGQSLEDPFPDAGMAPAAEAAYAPSSICHSAPADRASAHPSATPKDNH